MSDFLNFLNTAELETLTKISGITRPLAGSIIAARPFDTVDDCLKVRGMGKNLLTRMQSAYEAEESGAPPEESQPEANRAMVAVENSPIEKSAPAPEESKPADKPSFFARLWKAFANFMLALLRLILTIAFIAAIGAALYFGLPYLNDKLIVPVEKNTANIHDLETQVKDLQLQLDALNLRVGALEQTIETQSASIAKLEEMQAALDKEISAQNNSVMVALQREIAYTRAIETLSRARLYLAQSNFGLAKQDAQSARDIISALSVDAPAYQADALKQIAARLDLALGNLPAFPVIAAADVDIAWELMMLGLPQSAAEVMPTPTLIATPTLVPTFIPTPILEATPTITP
jgi:peptidoglycan hydrolase CwlO-like protein